jgi:hypothetical protein
MTIQEALHLNKYVKRPHWDSSFCHFQEGTGPFKDLVGCNYIVFIEDDLCQFSTSIDLYPEDIIATDYMDANLDTEYLQKVYLKEKSNI